MRVPWRDHGSGLPRALRWIGAEVSPGRFFEGEHVNARIAPFIATGLVTFLLVPILGLDLADWQVPAAFAIGLGIIGSALLVPWERLPAWTQVVPVLAGFAIIALLRDAAGSDAVIFEPLVIVPIAWIALYGTRAELWVAIGAMVAVMGLPPILIGDPYDTDQLIRAGIAAVIAGATGMAVQALVAATRGLAVEARAILETSQDAYISMDAEGTILEWNRQAELTFGWSNEEAVGHSINERVVPPADRDRAMALLRGLAGGTRQSGTRFEARGWRRDGTEFPLEVTVTAVEIAGAWTANAFIHDITSRKRAERAREDAEERFRRAFEDNRVGMALLDCEGVFARTNDAFCGLLGYRPDDLVGRGFPEITHPDDIDPSLTAVREMVAGERDGYRNEKRCLHSDGHHVWTAVNVSPIRDERGRTIHLIAQIEDITERKEQEAKLTHQAMHDPLTSLPNRVLFADRVRMASARRETGSFAVIYLDLDTFKPINDTLGHSAGDQVLIEVSRRLEELLREGDTLARLGGDEFAILCESTDEAGAKLIADRVIEAFDSTFSIEGREIEQAASIGVAVHPRDGRPADPEAILHSADVAMYRAKAAGKSRYALFEGWMKEESADRGQIEVELRRALAEKELTVHYQPEIELETGAVVGAEALVRWQHPERGLLEPAEFIGVAESSELIVAIDDFVLWQACHEAARWRRELGDVGAFEISVNLSERRLAEPGLSNKIAQAISDADLPAQSLCLEVAESAVLDRRGETVRALPDLEELGVRLLVDDFGVAISSFSALKRLPRLNAIKIDHSFITGLGRSEEDSAGVAALVGVAHGLKLTATAEGVETAEQLAELRRLDCDRAQGYFFAHPKPPSAFRELLESARYGELMA